jgi:flagellar biosynthesis protein FlhF
MVTAMKAPKGVQTFKAPDMPSALEQIQKALGPEALIVSVRQAPAGSAWQVWKKPGIEVVAMASGAVSKCAAPAAPAVAVAPRPATISAPAAPVVPAPVIPAQPAAPSAILERARTRLASQGLLPTLLDKITSTTARSLSATALNDTTRVTWSLQQQLEAMLLTEGEVSFARRHLVCLVGTTGAGKTTMAARLAARFTQLRGKSVAWICADTMRAGAIAQARVYADTLKLPLRVVYTPAELAQAVAAESEADLVLVDMPGCNPRREEAVVELGGYLAALPERSTYWVATATAKDADLADTLAAFHPFRLTGLIVTKLDETSSFGSVYNLAWQSRLPLAFFTASPRVLDELLPARPENLAEAVMEGTFRP